MTSYNPGDIVLVDVIFSDGTDIKKRPAVIISTREYHKGRREIIIAAVTGNIDRMLIGDTKIEKWKEAGLLFSSLAAGIVQTIKGRMIERKLGTLLEEDFQRMQKNIKKIIQVA